MDLAEVEPVGLGPSFLVWKEVTPLKASKKKNWVHFAHREGVHGQQQVDGQKVGVGLGEPPVLHQDDV